MREPPAVAKGDGSPWASPYRIPLQHDHALLAKLPACLQAPPAGNAAGLHGARVVGALDRVEAYVRHWGVLPAEVTGPIPDWGNVGGNVHQASGPAAIEWSDDINCVPVAVQTVSRVWEVAQQEVPRFRVGSLERLATYLAAQPLDGQGQPTGPRFVTNMNTGLCDAVEHPDGSVLTFRWHLRHHDGESPGTLVAAPVNFLPNSLPPPGLPASWSDWRYNWQGRYTEQMRALLSARWLRLFVELRAAVGSQWRIRAGGLLTVWAAPVNPHDIAPSLRAASVR